ncbi:MAG: FHA domain-containing protein [Elusimicrobiales bacterium]|nr:FHA domain-containing protein [Elusimicrobiales bacterium]
MPNLTILTGEEQGKTYAWQENAIRIGRNAANDFVVSNASVSSEHCVIEPYGVGGWRIKDLDSTNGTRVNNTRVTMATLHRNDVISLGDVAVSILGDDLEESEADAMESADSIPRTTIVMRQPVDRKGAQNVEGFSKKSESKRLLNIIIGAAILIVVALVILIVINL